MKAKGWIQFFSLGKVLKKILKLAAILFWVWCSHQVLSIILPAIGIWITIEIIDSL